MCGKASTGSLAYTRCRHTGLGEDPDRPRRAPYGKAVSRDQFLSSANT